MADDFRFDDEPPEDFLNDPFKEGESVEGSEEKEVRVVGVFEHHANPEEQQTEFVVLVRDCQNRTVLIVIGRFEAMAISLAIEGHSADRPLTHDLLNNIIGRMGGNVERILIDDLWNQTYYAKISINAPGKSFEIDSRPSDAIALALRSKAPIYMVESILQKVGMQEE